LKKVLALVLLAGVLLTGCSGNSAQTATIPSASATAAVASGIIVPNVVGKRLDEAMDELKDLSLKVAASDPVNGKTIILKSNWLVTSQDVAPGATVAKSTQVNLGVSHETDATPTPAPTPTPTPVRVVEAPAAEVAPSVVAPAPAAPPVVPAAPAAPAPGGGTIICKDGYTWPSTTRQGACSGHGGIRK
jgi:PBP1b-binding outer membrane lipoprotein LpoB